MSTTPEGVTQAIASEDQFQSLFDKGAFDTPPPREEAKGTEDLATDQPEPEPKVKAKAEPAEDEGEEYDSLEDYLAAAKLDPTAFQSLNVTVKVDGESRKVPLSDVIKSFQLEGHVNNKSIELSNAQKQFEQEREAAIGLYRQQITNAKALGDLAQAQLMAEFQQINWTQLRQTDPVQWTVMQQDFNNRSAAINQHLREVAAAQQTQEQDLRNQQAALLPKERERMLETHPEWRDPAKFDTDRKAMSAYAKQLGFSDAELAAIHDHRYMQVLHEAAQYRALQASNPETLKRVRAAPQMARPGTRTQRDPSVVAKQKAIERFNANPRDLDAQTALFETLA